jgi:hypothetical protein
MHSQKIVMLTALFAIVLAGLGAQGLADRGTGIRSGFVFFDGLYVEAPYNLESRDLSVWINGIQVLEPSQQRTSLVVTEDPGIPEGLTRDHGLDDLRAIKWNGTMPYYTAKLAYLWGRYDKEEAQQRMMQYYRSLPCIKEAVRVEGDGVRLTDYRGKTRVIDLFIHEWALRSPTEEELRDQAEALTDMFRERLQKGDCYFFFSDGTELIMAERKAVNVLREMRTILLDPDKHHRAKREELLRLGLIPGHDTRLAELVVSRFGPSSQFDERLEDLQADIVRRYGTEAIHGVVEDADRK